MAFPTDYATLVSNVTAKARLASGDSTDVGNWINRAYMELALETEWVSGTTSSAITTGDDSYSLASISSSIARIKAIQITSAGETGDPLELISVNQLISLRRGSNQSGTPTKYSLLGYDDLELWPVPDSSVTSMRVYWVGLPSALSSTNVPVFGEPYGSSAIEYGALVHAAEFKGDPKLEYWQQQALYWKSKLLQHLDMRRGGQPREMEFFPALQRPPHDPATIPPMAMNW